MKGGPNHHHPEPPKTPKLPPAFFISCIPEHPLHPLYTCRSASTTVQRPLQIPLYYAKQTQSQKPQDQPNPFYYKDLRNNELVGNAEKQTQSNPIQAFPKTIHDTQHDIRHLCPGYPIYHIRNSESAQLIDPPKPFWYPTTGPAESGVCLRF